MITEELKYGKGKIHFSMAKENLLGIIKSKKKEDNRTEEQIVLDALKKPIGSPRLCQIVKPEDKVCIVVSDITRAWQKMSFYLPYIVDELNSAGVDDKNIIFLSATGSHRGHTKEEHKVLLGEKLFNRFTIYDHNSKDDNNMVYLGTTSYGTNVNVNKIAVSCDHIILTGAIVFHLLAGFGGGKKSVLPGICSYKTIMQNHSMSLNPELGSGSNPEVRSGKIVNNPIYEDMLQAAALVKPSFLFNVVMDANGKIAHAVAGHYVEAHEAGCSAVEEMDNVAISEKADMVIATAGGYPKDINFYQSIKTIINAKECLKDNGVMIIVSECSDGFGNEPIREIIQNYNSLYEREKALRKSYSIEKYIGYYTTETAEKYTLILVSTLPTEEVSMANIHVVGTVDEALQLAYKVKGTEKLKTYIMPNGANTFPKC